MFFNFFIKKQTEKTILLAPDYCLSPYWKTYTITIIHNSLVPHWSTSPRCYIVDSSCFVDPLFKQNKDIDFPSRKSERHWPLINTERMTATGLSQIALLETFPESSCLQLEMLKFDPIKHSNCVCLWVGGLRAMNSQSRIARQTSNVTFKKRKIWKSIGFQTDRHTGKQIDRCPCTLLCVHPVFNFLLKIETWEHLEYSISMSGQ